MASILNNRQCLLSLAYGTKDGKTVCLKIMPGMNTWENIRAYKHNMHLKTEKDFEDAIDKVLEVDYVKILESLHYLVINPRPYVQPAEQEPVVRKRKKRATEEEL